MNDVGAIFTDKINREIEIRSNKQLDLDKNVNISLTSSSAPQKSTKDISLSSTEGNLDFEEKIPFCKIENFEIIYLSQHIEQIDN